MTILLTAELLLMRFREMGSQSLLSIIYPLVTTSDSNVESQSNGHTDGPS